MNSIWKNLSEFINRYIENIRAEASVSTVIKVEHIEKWDEIMKKL